MGIVIAFFSGVVVGVFVSYMRIDKQLDDFRLTLTQLQARNELLTKLLDRIERRIYENGMESYGYDTDHPLDWGVSSEELRELAERQREDRLDGLLEKDDER